MNHKFMTFNILCVCFFFLIRLHPLHYVVSPSPPEIIGYTKASRCAWGMRIVRIKFQIKCPELTYRCHQEWWWKCWLCETRIPIQKWHPASSKAPATRFIFCFYCISRLITLDIFTPFSVRVYVCVCVWLDSTRHRQITLIAASRGQHGCRHKRCRLRYFSILWQTCASRRKRRQHKFA